MTCKVMACQKGFHFKGSWIWFSFLWAWVSSTGLDHWYTLTWKRRWTASFFITMAMNTNLQTHTHRPMYTHICWGPKAERLQLMAIWAPIARLTQQGYSLPSSSPLPPFSLSIGGGVMEKNHSVLSFPQQQNKLRPCYYYTNRNIVKYVHRI